MGEFVCLRILNRAWSIAAVGGYATHGETFHREDEVLWWAKGGKLYGKAPERFAYLKSVIEEAGALEPVSALPKDPNGNDGNDWVRRLVEGFPAREQWQVELCFAEFYGRNEGHRILYLGRQCARYFELALPEKGEYRVEVIDIWEMTRRTALEAAHGKVRVELPAKEGIALLVTRLSGENL